MKKFYIQRETYLMVIRCLDRFLKGKAFRVKERLPFFEGPPPEYVTFLLTLAKSMAFFQMSSYADYRDDQLLELLAESDERAFREIYERNWSVIYAVGYKVAGTREAAEDSVQQVFMSLWDRRSLLRIKGNLQGYLATAVKYNALSLRLQQQNRAEILADLPAPLMTPAADQALEEKILAAFLAATIEKLPEKTRIIYLYSREEHLSNKEIAEQMDLSIKTVEAHITKALKTIKSSLLQIRMWLMLL